MGRTKSNKYAKLLEFDSIKQYLNGSIGAKKSSIGQNVSLEEKIANSDLSDTLRGLVIFLNEYFEEANTPYELINHVREMIRTGDEKGIFEFVKKVDDFTAWLKVHGNNGKGYADKTIVKYQANVRACLKYNQIVLKFKNYDVDSERQIQNEKLGIDHEIIKEIMFKIPSYTKNIYLKMLLEGMQKTGLGSAEIRSLTFGDLRYRFNGDDKKFTKIEKRRKKTNLRFLTYFYGEYKRKVIKYLEMHSDKKEFPDNKSWLIYAYHTFEQSFTTAYKNLIEQEYPEYLIYETRIRSNSKTGEKEEYEVLKKIVTMHWYRHIFITTGEKVRCPRGLINLFVAHKGDDKIDRIYAEVSDKDKLEFFKSIQEELFGIRESDTREQIEREIIDRFMENLLNKGKRQTIFDAVEHKHLDDLKNETNDRKMSYFIQKFLNIAENNAMKKLKNNEEFRKEIFSEFEEKLLEKYNLIPKE